MKAVLLVLVLAMCAATASLAGASQGAVTQLTITTHGGDHGDRTYTLGCDPAQGTVPKPADACATLQAHPDVVQPHPGEDHSCPGSSPNYAITGTFEGAPVAASFSPCVSGQGAGLVVWEQLVPDTVPVLHGRLTLKVDAALGPLRLDEPVGAVEHGASGQLLGDSQVTYRFRNFAPLYTHYGSDVRIDRIATTSKVDLGKVNVNRWRHFSCRPAKVYWHATGAKWTAVLVIRKPKSVWQVIVGTGAIRKTCSGFSLAPPRHHGSAS